MTPNVHDTQFIEEDNQTYFNRIMQKIHNYLRGSNFLLFVWAKHLSIFDDYWIE